ncbi:serine hydrolase [Sphingopyxis lindanitolerans]|uniref:Serine hydrolase n=1 Tax=Sphingopyxis lindanitolerans TaxID=2054227 RepID=A0A2S8B2F7_9SPHN|nr:serine hydrolase domain-containing protein [Sphingopyxis lindanitolerans]PQM26516.1 serine hydrolase [Sphingopyxis lindanitolerans]
MISPSLPKLASVARAIEADFLETGRFPGGHLRVLVKGKTIFDARLGHMDLARQTPWSKDAIVRIYSMTKPIVSAALMQLVERGTVRLDQPVADFLPGWRSQRVWVGGSGESMETVAAATPVTLRHLLTHSAGLTYGTRLAQIGGQTVEDPVALLYARADAAAAHGLLAYADALGGLPLRYQPGTRWMYSVATDVVGAIVEAAAGATLGDVLSREIFAPLGMRDTGFFVPPAHKARLGACYMATADDPLRLVDDPESSPFLAPPRIESGGGGLLSTLDDYARFAEMLRRGGDGLLAPASVAAMTSNQLPGGGELKAIALISDPRLLPDGMGFGFGLATTLDEARAGVPANGDYYWSGAATTIWWVDPARDLTVTFLTQLLPATAYGFQDWLKRQIYSAID